MKKLIDQIVEDFVRSIQNQWDESSRDLKNKSEKPPQLPSQTRTPLGNKLPATAHELAQMIDHTLLKADATESDIARVCSEARQFQFATVCVNGSFISQVAKLLEGSQTQPIAVVGFPLGAASTYAKVFEAREAIQNGAREIDMVINLGKLKSGHYTAVLEDIRAVVEASKPYPVKVILETALLDEQQKVIACALSKAADAAFVKTSTGFSTGGATADDIALMRTIVGPTIGVKASGGIRTTEDALKMIQSGANRIGASSSVAIVQAFGQKLAPSHIKNGDSGY